MDLILVRYGEIALKSKKVRARFEKKLVSNIKEAFSKCELSCKVKREWGRIYVYTSDIDAGIDVLQKVFGVVSFSSALETSANLDKICKLVSEYSKDLIEEGQSFAIRVSRVGAHPFTSKDVGQEVGAKVLTANAQKRVKVNLDAPDVEIWVEVREDKAYVFSEKIRGCGGFPYGTQGKVVALIKDQRSMVAAWLMMRKGCVVVPLYITSNKWISTLRKWGLKARAQRINSIHELSVVAKEVDADAIVVDVKVEDLPCLELPVFAPLTGLEEKRISEFKVRIEK